LQNQDRFQEAAEEYTPIAKLLSLLKPYAADEMEFCPVSRAVNSPAIDSLDCIAPI
jgi:putative SOS response-associated peptidase YedK